MKLYVESHLEMDPETAWEIFASDDFARRLEQATDLVCEVLETRTEGGITVRRLRYRSQRDLPRIAAKALGQPRLSYEQHSRFDPAASELHWEVFLPLLADRVKVSGRTTIRPAPGGCLRVVDGEIAVRMRLVGRQIEKVVVAEFERSMRRAVDLARTIHQERVAAG